MKHKEEKAPKSARKEPEKRNTYPRRLYADISGKFVAVPGTSRTPPVVVPCARGKIRNNRVVIKWKKSS